MEEEKDGAGDAPPPVDASTDAAGAAPISMSKNAAKKAAKARAKAEAKAKAEKLRKKAGLNKEGKLDPAAAAEALAFFWVGGSPANINTWVPVQTRLRVYVLYKLRSPLGFLSLDLFPF